MRNFAPWQKAIIVERGLWKLRRLSEDEVRPAFEKLMEFAQVDKAQRPVLWKILTDPHDCTEECGREYTFVAKDRQEVDDLTTALAWLDEIETVQ